MQIQLGTFAHVRVFNIISNAKNFLRCKTNACNDDDKALYLFNKHGMLQSPHHHIPVPIAVTRD
jgi:hypothetical protein